LSLFFRGEPRRNPLVNADGGFFERLIQRYAARIFRWAFRRLRASGTAHNQHNQGNYSPKAFVHIKPPKKYLKLGNIS
jgi:hypothetical protein